MVPERNDAFMLLTQYNQSESLIKHALSAVAHNVGLAG
jgi:predicted hydrolase (HD superfamily)